MLLTRNNSSPIHGRVRVCRTGRRGFSLLELMIVISIIMILMAVAVPAYQHHIIQARESVLHDNLRKLDEALEQYKLDKGHAPQSLDDLVPDYFHQLPVDPMTGKSD